MSDKPFDLPATLESTVAGFIEIIRRYLVTLAVLLFRPSLHRRRVLTTLEHTVFPDTNLLGPFTFLLICWFVANLADSYLARRFGISTGSYSFPSPRELLEIGTLFLHILAPLALLCVVYALVYPAFLLSGARISFTQALTVIAYPYGFALIAVVSYPALRQLVPQPLAVFVSIIWMWVLMHSIYGCVAELYPQSRRRLKWSLIGMTVVYLIAGGLLARKMGLN